MLIPARTDTTYFHDYIYGKAEIRFIRGRVRFTDEERPLVLAGAAVVAVLLGLFAAGLFRLLWLSVPYETWVEYERARRNRKRTCNTCKHQPQCDAFFSRKYSALKTKEPEALKTAACKIYQERPPRPL